MAQSTERSQKLIDYPCHAVKTKNLLTIANDQQTPKKRDLPLQNDLYERMDVDEYDSELNDWDTSEPIPLAEF